MNQSLISWAKPCLYPWAGMLLARPGKARPYFGTPSRGLGGPALKRKKLIRRFGNHWLAPNLLYVISGLSVSIPFLGWAKKRGVPILLNQDGVYSPSWAGADYRQGNERLSKIHALADYVFYQSRFCREAAGRYLRLPSDQDSEVLYNAVDLEHFTPGIRRPTEASVTLLCAGYFYASKHYILHALLEGFRLAMSSCPGLKLVVAGKIESGAEGALADAEWLFKAAADHGIPKGPVTFQKTYRSEEAPALFRSADVFIHLKNNDPCPSIVLEALASGLPVIHCANGGTPELVGDAGVAIAHPAALDQPDQAPSREQIAQAIQETLNRRDILSSKARERAAHFSMTSWIKRHSEKMKELLETHA